MNWKERENELKLDILESLARSQKALARMIESMADVSEGVSGSAQALRANIMALVRCQRALAGKIGGIRISSIKRGQPGKAWLHPKVRKPDDA